MALGLVENCDLTGNKGGAWFLRPGCHLRRTLNALGGQRNRGGYDVGTAFSQPTADGQVRIAEEIIQTIDAAAVEPTRTQITNAMKIYERDVLHDVTWQP